MVRRTVHLITVITVQSSTVKTGRRQGLISEVTQESHLTPSFSVQYAQHVTHSNPIFADTSPSALNVYYERRTRCHEVVSLTPSTYSSLFIVLSSFLAGVLHQASLLILLIVFEFNPSNKTPSQNILNIPKTLKPNAPKEKD